MAQEKSEEGCIGDPGFVSPRDIKMDSSLFGYMVLAERLFQIRPYFDDYGLGASLSFSWFRMA